MIIRFGSHFESSRWRVRKNCPWSESFVEIYSGDRLLHKNLNLKKVGRLALSEVVDGGKIVIQGMIAEDAKRYRICELDLDIINILFHVRINITLRNHKTKEEALVMSFRIDKEVRFKYLSLFPCLARVKNPENEESTREMKCQIVHPEGIICE